MSAGARRHLVQLEDRPDDGALPNAMDPSEVWVSLEQSPPSSDDEDLVTYTVRLPYHPQINTDTVLLLSAGQELVVRGVRSLGALDRTLELWCHEVRTP